MSGRYGGVLGSGRTSRRRFLLGVGGSLTGLGGLLIVSETGAFSTAQASRTSTIDVTSDDSAYVGLFINDPVKKNNQELLVEVTNNVGETVDFTVELDTCTDGTLYGPNGSGCAVSFSLASGSSETVDIEAVVSDTTVPFTIIGNSASFGFEGARETTAESGNTAGAVKFKKLTGFSANTGDNNWTIEKIRVIDNDGDDDLERVEYKITDESGTTRATKTDNVTDGSEYKRFGNNNPGVTIDPESGYSVQSGETYRLRATAYDADGNYAIETREDTAP